MAKDNLTSDQQRLLILISRFSKPSKKRDEAETWIKKIPLLALVSQGIYNKIFENYDFTPQLVDYMGLARYASISKEGEDDIADLRRLGYVERLKLATSHHVYVSAYRITYEGLKVVQSFDENDHKAVDELVKCKKCDGEMKVESLDDSPYLICKKCYKKEKVNIFEIEEVSYVSKPVFSDVWLPPDS